MNLNVSEERKDQVEINQNPCLKIKRRKINHINKNQTEDEVEINQNLCLRIKRRKINHINKNQTEK